MDFSKLPQMSINPIACREEDPTYLIVTPTVIWQAQLYHHRLQGAVVLQEEQRARRVDAHPQCVDAPQVRHQIVVVVQNIEPILLYCLHEHKFLTSSFRPIDKIH